MFAVTDSDPFWVSLVNHQRALKVHKSRLSLPPLIGGQELFPKQREEIKGKADLAFLWPLMIFKDGAGCQSGKLLGWSKRLACLSLHSDCPDRTWQVHAEVRY